MGRDTEKVLGGPAIALVGIGAIIDIILFYFMASNCSCVMLSLTKLLPYRIR